jgi:putative sterol carrier protein
MADWQELEESLAEYQKTCNSNERLRKMQKDWSKIIHFKCSDNDITFTMEVVNGEITGYFPGFKGQPDIIVETDSETFCDMFWGDLNPVSRYLRGEIKVKGSQEDIMRLDAISAIIWPD